MATYATRRVVPGSLDAAGVSVASATPDLSDPRTGGMYNPSTLAGASPVWFHPMSGGRWVAILARRLIEATPASPQSVSGPLVYSQSTNDTTPYLVVFDPASGAVSDMSPLPTRVTGNRFVVSAVSRGNYLFVLSTLNSSSVLLQHFRNGSQSTMILQAEEVLPASLGSGLYVERNDIIVFGSVGGLLTAARRNWGRIGEPSTTSDRSSAWRYWSGRGWSYDLPDLSALPGDVSVSGPVSATRWRSRMYLAVAYYSPAIPGAPGIATVPARWDAKFYSSRDVDEAWAPHPVSVYLGNTVNYQGGTAYFQPQLSLTPGYTVTTTSRGRTVLDSHSDAVQVFNGMASHTVQLPDVASSTFEFYNQTMAGTLSVITAGGGHVGDVLRGQSAVFTHDGDDPDTAGQWVRSSTAGRSPARRSGFSYLYTTRYGTSPTPSQRFHALRTSWSVLEV